MALHRHILLLQRKTTRRVSYEKEEKGMPPKTDKIVMALELFASNTEHPHEIKNNMRETREYWKQYIPEDGVRLDQLLERL